MKVRILGTAAGGGLPQWNCGCPNCGRARAGPGRRTQDCLAISADGAAWTLVNASADLGMQLALAPELAPAPGTRSTPLRDILLTSAEVDHTVGLVSLRQAGSVRIHATRTVWDALPFAAVLSPYTRVEWRRVDPDREFTLGDAITVHAFAPGAKPPRYAAGRPGREWTVAYRFTDRRTGGILVYAPGLARWTPEFAAGLAGATIALIDGTFASATELPDAPAMGHLAIAESLPHLRAHPGPQYLYTHLNHTNPFAYAQPAAQAELSVAGARVARDGETLEL